jgi:3-oxoacyl-[acyl-carrier protein] reductase
MSTDLYSQVVNSPPGRLIAPRLGLPQPPKLERHEPGAPVVSGPVLHGAAPGGRLDAELERVLDGIGAARAVDAEEGVKALVFDATGIDDPARLGELYAFFHPLIRSVGSCGRVVVLGTPPESLDTRAAVAQRALEGFTRSVGKEIGRGIAVQLVYVAKGAERELESTLRFLLSPKSAYVSGQVVRVDKAVAKAGEVDWEQPLKGKTALVTGASRGIGRAIAETLHRDGADLVLLDVPALSDELREVAGRLGAKTIELDITEDDAPQRIGDALGDGVDVVVHNAGVTKDRTMAKMPEGRWSTLMEINLSSEERIDDELLSRDLLRENGRIVCVSSMSGIAGNSGQTNYATSKAGVIGMVEAMAPQLAKRGATINAVAPGFIETQMTAKMPIAIREAGRRMNSMSQGGVPVDVAETIAWLASPASAGVNGNTVRVCGQSLLGA